MTESEDVDRLKRRLNREGAGPLADLSNHAVGALTARGREVADWVRDMAEDRPLISVWTACQIGFVIGRWGPRRAKH
jgi:hypothetical protein